ncbi:Rod shape-determining protein RodA [hydrothermal vent metagenome]|uniref:Rod shape-determining protein RodA n=1 Tax=hydrothermal vent metagenome TaxID=652676 RepID=A0A3B0THV5_9ZZZZ
MALAGPRQEHAGFSAWARLRQVNWVFASLLVVLAAIGAVELYSVAGESMDPWARAHLWRFSFAFTLFLVVAIVDIRFWMAVSLPIYGLALAGLVAVQLAGATYGGATRWLSLGGLSIQPSELMKIGLVMALARIYQTIDAGRVSHPRHLVLPLVLIAVPTGIIALQPDLGTAVLLLVSGFGVMALAGVHWLYFLGGGIAAAAAAPFAWSMLYTYQKIRVMTFLDPERDPLGAGFNIIQSKIALGSGGAFGRGFGNGTQSDLNFVPEKHTDFIFTVFGEEFGFAGAVVVLVLFMSVIGLGLKMSARVENRFGRLVGGGVTITLFAFVFVNVAMVTGLVPVVGVPLPLISYGGTVMLAVMFGLGLLMSAHVHARVNMPRPLARRK